MKLSDWNDAGFALVIDRLHLGIERPHGYRHVGGVGSDAMIAGAEDCVNAVEAAEGCATRAGIALVAGFGDVVEVITTRSLQQVAAGGGLVPQLLARTREQRAAEHAVAPPHPRVGR